MSKTWENYLSSINLSSYTDRKDTAFYNVNFNISKLLNYYGLSEKEKEKSNLKLILKDVMFHLGANELLWKFRPCKTSDFLDEEIIKLDYFNDLEIEILLLSADLFEILKDWAEAIADNNFSMVHYCISRIFEILFDISAIENIDLRSCLTTKEAKETKRKTKNFEENKIDSFEEDFQKTKLTIKNSGAQEIIFDLITTKTEDENKISYRGLKIKKGRNIFKYETGDIITDFFSASNFIAEELKDKDYRFNYTADLRAVLFGIKDAIFSGYIKDGNLISLEDLRKNASDNKEKTFFIDRSYRPILMTKKIKTFDDLIEHVVNVKNKNK